MGIRAGAAINIYRKANWCYRHKLGLLAKMLYYINIILFNCVIPSEVVLCDNVRVTHSVGIVIHQWSVIHSNVVIGHNVSLVNDKIEVGEGTFLGTGCVIIGPCQIGSNCKIGANTVVNFDVPDNSTVVGVKGHIVKKKHLEEENES